MLHNLSIDVSLALYSMSKNNIIQTQPHVAKGISNVGEMTDPLCFGIGHAMKRSSMHLMSLCILRYFDFNYFRYRYKLKGS